MASVVLRRKCLGVASVEDLLVCWCVSWSLVCWFAVCRPVACATGRRTTWLSVCCSVVERLRQTPVIGDWVFRVQAAISPLPGDRWARGNPRLRTAPAQRVVSPWPILVEGPERRLGDVSPGRHATSRGGVIEGSGTRMAGSGVPIVRDIEFCWMRSSVAFVSSKARRNSGTGWAHPCAAPMSALRCSGASESNKSTNDRVHILGNIAFPTMGSYFRGSTPKSGIRNFLYGLFRKLRKSGP